MRGRFRYPDAMEQLLEFAGNHPLLVTAFVVIANILVFNELRLAGTARFAVSTDQAVRLMNKGALVLDVRDQTAYEKGHLKGAKHVPLADIGKRLDDFDRYRAKPVIAYDERGSGAGRAVAQLRRNSFEHAFMLRGGLATWREEHLPLVRPGSGSGKKA